MRLAQYPQREKPSENQCGLLRVQSRTGRLTTLNTDSSSTLTFTLSGAIHRVRSKVLLSALLVVVLCLPAPKVVLDVFANVIRMDKSKEFLG